MAYMRCSRGTLRRLLGAQTSSSAASITNPILFAGQGLRYRKQGAILTTTIDKLGKAGETVKVAPGHFRNHLMPKLLAVPSIEKYAFLIREQRKHALCQSSQFLRHSALTDSTFQRFGFSSTASLQSTEKEENQSGDHDNASQNTSEVAANTASTKAADDSAAQEATKDADAELELSYDDLVKLIAEKEESLKLTQKNIEKMQDKVLRSYAEMENVIDRTKREAENSKKFAVQNFVKSLLDVADNLGRASSVVKESFLKIDASKDSSGAVPLLKTLLEGVEMTEKQLSEVFRKFGVEKYDPINEQFDPNRHLAVFQVPDASKPPGTVAAVLKAGYMMHDRVLRPAEVGVVTQALDNETHQSSSA